MEVLARDNDGGSAGGIQHHGSGVASSKHRDFQSFAVCFSIGYRRARQRSLAESPGGVSDEGKGRG